MRRLGRLVVMAVAVLALSGCWAVRYQHFEGPSYVDNYAISLTEQKSTEVIFYCEAHFPGNANARAACAMDLIRLACHQQPIGFQDCTSATDHSDDADGCVNTAGTSVPCISSMKTAIVAVIGNRECITYEHSPEDIGPSHLWIGADKGGLGCI